MAASTGNVLLDAAILIGGYYVFTHPSTGLDMEAALAYQEGVLVPSRRSKDIAKLQQLLSQAQSTGQTAAATTIQAYLSKLQGAGSVPSSGSGPSTSAPPKTRSTPSTTTYTPAALRSCTMQVLQVGEAGPCVAAVQARLDTLIGAGLPTGGHFDGNLEAAVRRFQQQQGITVDGIVGPQTWNRLINPYQKTATHQPTTSAPPKTVGGRPTGAYGVPTTYPTKLVTGAHGLPAGYELYTATGTGLINLSLSTLHSPVKLAVWRPPATLINQQSATVMLGLGRAYTPANTARGPAVLSPYWGVAEYQQHGSTWRLTNVYAQSAQAKANATISGTAYFLRGIGPGGASF